MTVKIFHNPRCSKSRETLALLEENAVSPEIVEYLKDVPSAQDIKQLLSLLNFDSARQLMRTKETIYKELNLKDETSEDALIDAMVANPKLIERPIVINNGKAAIGRPPESVLAII
ncbi:MAG: arsenate reductase (glutaredoxin) [Pseudomonadota bacterium]|uniref:arsenate reductase (glutaredoxin) n=1 Tax=Pseudoalteromonas TaxID=53246 RepID=UPI00026CBB65|nr:MULTISPECIES: arsenate reductase (glutaredoxin) [Pseudoalteromonas]ATC98939.1 arsenate reductase [Pseudoalteromonas spongiae UST010723-006]MCF6456215.1 arsenate reductase (glutaredoxin) [Pseudoalteromonas sp. MMG024]MEC8326832.1 arsenate reductase (glutaredoxin) [Pseudomonadota bacterium]